MFQQAFGFVRPAPQSAASATLRSPFLPSRKRPLLNFARVGTIHERLALPRTASHTRPQASSTKNLSPSRSIGCASRFVRPCNDAAPAEPKTKEPPRIFLEF